MIGVKKIAKQSITRQEVQVRLPGIKNEKEIIEVQGDTKQTWRKSDIHNERKGKGHVAKYRLI